MVVVPGDTPETKPVVFTVAMAVLPLLQVPPLPLVYNCTLPVAPAGHI